MGGLQTVGSALLTLGLVAIAVALSLYERLDLEKDIGVAVIRSFVQLAAIGYVIDYVFGLENLWVVVMLLAGMVLFAAWTSARRARDVPNAFLIAVVAVGVAAVATLVLLLALGIVPATARYLIPLGGMVIGNSMNACSLTMTRIHEDHGNNIPAGGHGRHDHRRGRPARSSAPPDSGPVHAPGQRLHSRDPGRNALLPLLLHPTIPARNSTPRTPINEKLGTNPSRRFYSGRWLTKPSGPRCQPGPAAVPPRADRPKASPERAKRCRQARRSRACRQAGGGVAGAGVLTSEARRAKRAA